MSKSERVVRVVIDGGTHRDLKAKAASRGTTLQEAVRQAARLWINHEDANLEQIAADGGLDPL